MSKSLPMDDPPLGMGLTSVVLGVVGVLLFSLPILSIPLGGIGLAFGLCSLVLALLGGWTSLRWSIAGIAVSGLALGIGIAIAQAPLGYLPTRSVPFNTQSVPDRPYVPPPARPRNAADTGNPGKLSIVDPENWTTTSSRMRGRVGPDSGRKRWERSGGGSRRP
jgi:hypothetical protein